MKPGWTDVLRFAPYSLLRVELVLKPALREALAMASASAGRCLQALEGAQLSVQELSPGACRLQGRAPGGEVQLVAQGTQLQAQATFEGQAHEFHCSGLMLQTGGSRDCYVAQSPETGGAATGGGPVPLLHLRYGADPGAVSVVMFSAGLAARVAPPYRAWLPARIELLRLVACAAVPESP
jgi:hypothetical protein